MPILRIKLVDAAGLALAGVAVAVSDVGELQSNADGITQFLTGGPAPVEITIHGKLAWTGDSGQLLKDEKFQQGPAGFARVH